MEEKRIAAYAGTFDPVTLGHLAIITEVLSTYDEVIITLGKNPDKNQPLFGRNYRKELIRIALEELVDDYEYRALTGRDYSPAEIKAIEKLKKKPDIVKIESFDGMLVDFAIRNKIDNIIRGERIVGDHDAETKLNMMNKMLCDVRRVHLSKHQITVPQEKLTYISSSSAKEFASKHEYACAANFVTPRVLNLLTAKYLRHDFRKLCEKLGIDEMDEIDNLWFDLRRTYLPRRDYPLSFIGYSLNYLNIYVQNFSGAENYNVLKAALYYAFYNTEENEKGIALSQQASRDISRYLGREDQTHLEKLINLLRKPELKEHEVISDLRLLRDVTSVIYADRNNFGSFMTQLRVGQSKISDSAYAEKRAKQIEKLLSQQRIYQLDYFFEKFEEDARINLTKELNYWQGIKK